jgi:hypothetical protein
MAFQTFGNRVGTIVFNNKLWSFRSELAGNDSKYFDISSEAPSSRSQ